MSVAVNKPLGSERQAMKVEMFSRRYLCEEGCVGLGRRKAGGEYGEGRRVPVTEAVWR